MATAKKKAVAFTYPLWNVERNLAYERKLELSPGRYLPC